MTSASEGPFYVYGTQVFLATWTDSYQYYIEHAAQFTWYHSCLSISTLMSNSFASFNQSFKGDISTPGDADYAKAISRWALNAQANAKIVAFVKIPEDVALAIAYARENRLPIAIRGGAHSTAGASSTEGLVIDLSRHLNAVEIDPENKLAYVGGGAIWEHVDKASTPHGLASVAGTVNHVCCTAQTSF